LNGKSDLGPEDVIAFWSAAGRGKWFKKDDNFDRAIADQFKALHAEVAAGGRRDWATTPEGALALILVLDQFSRNMFRDTPMAFAQDEMALALADAAIAAGFDKSVPRDLALFFYLPFEHAERIAAQEKSVLLLHTLGSDETLSYARAHERVIRRFGRFPHRNPILGRHMSPAEQAFLDGGGFAG
jgi:uncharacterized protein (DUF924 family)